ncbi:MAG: hypothetical protein HY394_01255 [Candidatus Diapherotrites archaeon]|nr:hypothetical protein [Candidatus Diapherotrites archaeon]
MLQKLVSRLNGFSFERKFLLVSAIVFIALYLFFYPPFFTSIDESQFVKQAWLFLHGKIGEQDPLQAFDLFWNGSFFVPRYPPLAAFLLVPFLFFGWQFSFLLNLLMHLAGFSVFYLLLKRLRINPAFAVLYLFFPASALFSRFAVSEPLSSLLVLLAAYFYLSDEGQGIGSKGHFLAGAFFGLSLLARYTNVLAFAPFLLFAFFDSREKLARLVVGALPFIALLLLFNNAAFGGFLETGYSITGERLKFEFGTVFAAKLFSYVLVLLAVFPAMLAVVFVERTRLFHETVLASALFLLFFSAYFWSANILGLSDVLTKARFFLPITGLLLVPYASFLSRMASKFSVPEKPFLFGILAVLAIATLFVFSAHSNAGREKLALFEKLQSSVPDGSLAITQANCLTLKDQAEHSDLGMFFGGMFNQTKSINASRGFEKYVPEFRTVFLVNRNCVPGNEPLAIERFVPKQS